MKWQIKDFPNLAFDWLLLPLTGFELKRFRRNQNLDLLKKIWKRVFSTWMSLIWDEILSQVFILLEQVAFTFAICTCVFCLHFYSVSKQNFLSRRWDLHLRFRVAFLWNAMTTTASKLIWSGALPVSSSNLMYLIVCYQVQNLQADVLSECPVDLEPIS